MNFETQIPADADDTAEARPRRLWYIVGAAVAVLLVLVVAAKMLRSNKEEEAAALAAAQAAAGPIVTVVVPGRSEIQGRITATGSLAARRDMPVGVVGEGGMVTRVLVEPGTWVRKGQVLAVIERSVQTEEIRSLAAQVEVARADARLAQSELARAQALVSRGFVSRADIDRRTATRDQATARVNVAIAQLEQARARTGRLDIRAPENGLVLTRAVEPGQVVSGGSGVLFRMAKDGEMELMARVGESDMARIPVGAQVQVTPVGTDRRLSGRVWQVAPVVDPQTRQGMVRVSLGYDRAVRPGGFAAATFLSGTAQVPLLPESAVQNDQRGSFVYIVQNGRVHRRDVKVGQVSDRGVAVQSGLAGNEQVVAMAGAFLAEGQKVRPRRSGGEGR